jgi:hypothetical protein
MENRETILSSGSNGTHSAELRLSATLLFVGVLISIATGLFHPAYAAANDTEIKHTGDFVAGQCLPFLASRGLRLQATSNAPTV